jgi:hypothetical protein
MLFLVDDPGRRSQVEDALRDLGAEMLDTGIAGTGLTVRRAGRR